MEILITGGAGFIGTNAAEYFAKKGASVVIVDNLGRKGGKNNLNYLLKKYPKNITFSYGDIRDRKYMDSEFLEKAKRVDLVLHFAAQVAVTTSVENPRKDFEINAVGTLNVLEILRKIKKDFGKSPVLIYSSTNKVYGAMENEGIINRNGKYYYKNLKEGIDENTPLDFHSPYGCSKGTADQYIRDYHRIYDLDIIVMRQSCIYGERQLGVEDQGWVAWFAIAASLGRNIKIYGDGMQVRDVLWAEDLIRAYELAYKNINKTRGQIYNLGGGPKNEMSLLELLSYLEKASGKKINYSYGDWRPGDQKVCIMNISKAKKDFGWEPKVSPEEGVKKLYNWVQDNLGEIRALFSENKKTAILVEALVNKGGIEREIMTLKKYLNADIIAGLYDSEGTFPIFKNMNIKFFAKKKLPLILNTLYVRRKFKSLNLNQYHNLIFFGGHSLTSAKKDKNNIWYCNAPIRYIYDCYGDTLRTQGKLKRIPFIAFSSYLRRNDRKYFKKLDKVLVNSNNVQKRIEKYYNNYDSEVVYPPVDIDNFKFVSQRDYYLVCTRLSPEKNALLVAQAFKLMPDKKLVIIGDGPDQAKIEKIAAECPNISYLGPKTSSELVKIYGECIAVIYVSKKEDFGMVPIEAMASGKPCIGANDGGMRETIIHGKTGLLIKQTIPEIIKAVKIITPRVALKMRKDCEKRSKDFREEFFAEGIMKHLK